MTTPSKDPRYVAAKRRYNKASTTITNAIAFIQKTTVLEDDPNWTYQAEQNSFHAILMLEGIQKQLNADLRVVEKECGVGTYQPYGPKYVRVRRY
jgi:hypothetical protein